MLNGKLCEELAMASFVRQIDSYGDVRLLRGKRDVAIERVRKDVAILRVRKDVAILRVRNDVAILLLYMCCCQNKPSQCNYSNLH